jgi:hypothetical protein
MRLLGRTMDLVTSWTINSGEPLMAMSKPVRGWLRMTAPLAALVAMLALAALAWASTVQIQDDAHVLNATTV